MLWDKNTGEPVHNAIVWQDTRTDALCQELGRNVGQDRFRRETGPAARLATSPGPRSAGCSTTSRACASAPRRGDILFGTMDSWVIWNLTGGVDGGHHVTDVTNASRTMLMNLHTLEWDEKILPSRSASRRRAAGDPLLRRGLRRVTGGSGDLRAASRSPPRSATSRRPCSARPVSPRARPSPRTAPAPSC